MIKLIETAAALLCQPRPTKAVPYSMYSMLHAACVCQGSMRSNELSYDKLIPGPGQCAAAHRWPALIGCSSRSFYYWSHKAHSVQSHIPAVHTWQHNMQTDHSDSHPPAPSVVLASRHHGIMASWQHGIMASWHHDIMTSWHHDIMTS